MKTYCFLVPNTKENLIRKYYLEYINEEDCIFIPLYFDPTKKKTSVADMRSFLEEKVYPRFKEEECKYLLVCDGDYFKCISKKLKIEVYLGYVLPVDDYFVAYVPSYEGALYRDQEVRAKIKQALDAVQNHALGRYLEPGRDIIKTAVYPSTPEEIALCLDSLHASMKLTCDIETWSLKHYDSGIASITFCWNEHEGIAFCVDHSQNQRNEEVRQLLRNFFETYKGTLIFHNITFDMYILTYQLYMNDLLDTEGLLHGMDVLLKNFEDTKIIAYLATNSCTGNVLGLKALAQEFAGNYAQEEINNLDAIDKKQLLEYNLIDGLSTWFVYNKYYQKMIDDQQLNIYENLFKPAVKDIIQMQLTGLPMDMDQVLKAEQEMESIKNEALEKILLSPLVREYMENYRVKWAEKRNQELKKKRVTPEECPDRFNPDSNNMLRELLYESIGLEIIEKTETKLPATGKDTLAKLLNHTNDEDVINLLNALIDYKDVIKILTAFIPAFKSTVKAKDGRYYLYGNQNSTGTVSGRYSSNSPNLANLPSTGSKFAKLVKSCFAPPKGILFVGIDFQSLEDKINALLTRDPNKMLVYTDGYDSHSLRCYNYYKDQLSDITKELEEHPEDRVNIINSIKERHKDLRSRSKAPTFALTYSGSHITLQKNCGFSEEEAKRIEKAYHDLYAVSDHWSKTLLQYAGRKGYIIGAFGLKIRTPILYRSLQGLKVTPKEVQAESRTANNAATQGYGMLTVRAIKAFMEKVRNSPYRTKIRVCNIIHDAAYFLVEDDVDVFLWLNENLVKEFQWQEDPAIAHDKVHLGGEVSIFFPNWAHEITVPNHCSKEELFNLVDGV